MSEVDAVGYAVVEGVVRKVKILSGGLYRDGKHWVVAVLHNPKKAAQASDDARKEFLIDPMFVSRDMDELIEKSRSLRADTLKALTTWSTR